jgi:hypothetical protein
MLREKSSSWEKSWVKAHPDVHYFYKVHCEIDTFKLKLKYFNFGSIKLNHQWASPISSDYPFKY